MQKFVTKHVDWAHKLGPNVEKNRVCNVYIFQLSFHFAYHSWWLGICSPSSIWARKKVAPVQIVCLPYHNFCYILYSSWLWTLVSWRLQQVIDASHFLLWSYCDLLRFFVEILRLWPLPPTCKRFSRTYFEFFLGWASRSTRTCASCWSCWNHLQKSFAIQNGNWREWSDIYEPNQYHLRREFSDGLL